MKAKHIKAFVGIAISLIFMWLAFKNVNFSELKTAFLSANYFLLIPTLVMIFFSHWLRSVRWYYFLYPVRPVPIMPLFSSLLIGYMANCFLPAHLGEFVRAYVAGKKENMAYSTVMATIIVERIIDVICLLLLLGLSMVVFPFFPEWVQKGGYAFLIFTFVLIGVLILLKKNKQKSMNLITFFCKPLPQSLGKKIIDIMDAFLEGIRPMAKKWHYVAVFVLTFAIWGAYLSTFYFTFFAFGFHLQYGLGVLAALILTVFCNFSVMVPSSPGYVGTYHYVCLIALGFFSVPKSSALSYAFVIHGLNFFPIILVGLIVLYKYNLTIKRIQQVPQEIK